MNQCMRCSRPCEAGYVFCEACRSLLRTQLWQEADTLPGKSIKTLPAVVLSPEHGEVSGDPLDRITSPQPIVKPEQMPQWPNAADQLYGPTLPLPLPHAPVTPPISPLPLSESGNDSIDTAIEQLNEAARRIAPIEQGRRRQLHAPRLAPLQKAEIEITRESTPLRSVSPSASPKAKDTPATPQEEDLGEKMPDLWPWLHNGEQEENEREGEIWLTRTDPLQSRQVPRSNAYAQIDEDELQRAVAEGLATRPLPTSKHRRTRHWVQAAFAILAVLAILAVAFDSFLLSFALLHTHHKASSPNGPPSLTLSPNEASVGQTVALHMADFAPNTQIYITHDVQENVELTSNATLVPVGNNGMASASILINASWGPGFHSIQAEDIQTRNTASATLQIIGSGPTRPSHLVIGSSSLNFGADYQGTNTLQTLALHNSGDGSISWSASSNQPWLLLAPNQGTFSDSQSISVAVERANLQPGNYSGILTFSSNVGANEWIEIHMSVRPLPANVGSVLQTDPALFSFSALDGGASPATQTLTISNPGSQTLNWSLANNNPILLGSQSLVLQHYDAPNNWLSTNQTSGSVAPHSSQTVLISVNSRNLLPGVYTDMLVFDGGQGVLDSTQNVGVALTIQPNCTVEVNTGSMAFTAVAGQGNPANQSLSINATTSCVGTLNWRASASAGWLSVTPPNGQLKGAEKTIVAVSVNIGMLKPATYQGTITFIAGLSTQTVTVQLLVQTPPAPSAPVLGAAPLNLNFSTTQGLPNPPGQVVTITNTGGGTLYWNTTVNILSDSWLGASPTGGSIAPGGTAQLTVNIDTQSLTPNTYVGQVILNGTNSSGVSASGSPQTIMVNLVVLAPCSLQPPSSSQLAFSAVAGSSNPAPQSVSISASGNCNWPVNWNGSVSSGASWLSIAPASGSFASSGQAANISVSANISGLAPNTYTAQVSIAAVDGTTNVQGSPQTFTVTLTVLPPCLLSLQAPPGGFTFTMIVGQPTPAPQNLSFSESGTCARPVSWTATSSTGSQGWLLASPTSGSDFGRGATTSISVNPQNLVPGTYNGTITIAASGNGGGLVENSPLAVNVTFTITTLSLSGTVMACSDPNCTTSNPLPGAAVTLENMQTLQSWSATADGSGNYTFSNIGVGTYTLSATGSNGSQNYSGSMSVTVSGTMTNVVLDTYVVSEIAFHPRNW
jgi:hypothetical protein